MLSGYGKEAQLPRGMWYFPGPGIKLMSPALADRFITTLDHQKSVNMNITSLVEEVEYWDSSLGMMMQKWQVASVCDLKSHGSWAATGLWGGPAKLQRKWVLKSLFLILKTLRDLLENSDRHWFHLELVGCSGCLSGYLETHTLSGVCFFI